MIALTDITGRRKQRPQKPLLMILLGSLLFLPGCGGTYGSLQRSDEVNQLFLSYHVLPDHNYFYAGPHGRPDAIMGIHEDYTLLSTQWQPLDPSGDLLRKGVDSINFHNSTRVRNYPYGFMILSPEGRQVGIWYSIWDWTTIVMEKGNRVRVFPPAVEDPAGNGRDLPKMKFD